MQYRDGSTETDQIERGKKWNLIYTRLRPYIYNLPPVSVTDNNYKGVR